MDYGCHYAVNLAAMLELTRRSSDLPLLLLMRGIVTDTKVWPLGRDKWAHDALLVSEDVTPERWDSIVTLVRKKFRYDQFPLYEKGKRGWKTIR